MKLISMFILIIAGLASIIIACAGMPPCPRPGDSAPDFTYHNLKGEKVSLNDFKGKSVIVIIWDVGCAGCPPAMDDIRSVYEENSSQGLVVLAVDTADSNENVQRFIEDRLKEGRDYRCFTFLLDSEDTIRAKFCIKGSNPNTLFIDRDGKLSQIVCGPKGIKEVAKDLLKSP